MLDVWFWEGIWEGLQKNSTLLDDFKCKEGIGLFLPNVWPLET